MSVSSRHLFISTTILSWMDVNFLNHYPCMQLCSGALQFSNFLSVALSESTLFLPKVLLHVLVALFPCCLFIWLFCYVLSIPIFCPKIVLLPLHLVVSMSLCILPSLAGRIFSLFWNVLFCLYSLILSWYPFSPPPFVSTFWFISWSCIICFNCVAFFFLSQHILVSVWAFLLVVIDFLSVFSV